MKNQIKNVSRLQLLWWRYEFKLWAWRMRWYLLRQRVCRRCECQWRGWFPVLQAVYQWVLVLGVLAFVVYGFLAQWFGWVAPVPVRPVPHW